MKANASLYEGLHARGFTVNLLSKQPSTESHSSVDSLLKLSLESNAIKMGISTLFLFVLRDSQQVPKWGKKIYPR